MIFESPYFIFTLSNYMKQKIGRIKVIIYNVLIIFIKTKILRPYHNIVVVFVKVTSLFKPNKSFINFLLSGLFFGKISILVPLLKNSF